MKGLIRFLKVTLVGGIVLLVPLVLGVVVVEKAFHILKFLSQPLDRLIPVQTVAGVAFVDLLTVVIMLALCVLAGLAALSPVGQKLIDKLDKILLIVVPGYCWFKGVTGSVSDDEAKVKLKPVSARLDDQWLVGFEVDRAGDGMVAVYLPGSPDPRSGSVCYMAADRVKPVPGDFHSMMKTLKRLGCDSAGFVDAAK